MSSFIPNMKSINKVSVRQGRPGSTFKTASTINAAFGAMPRAEKMRFWGMSSIERLSPLGAKTQATDEIFITTL